MSFNFKSFLQNHILEVSIFLLSFVLAMVLWNMNELRLEIHKTTAIENASIYLDAYEALRSAYTTEVVSRVLDKNIIVTHNYKEIVGAIPLPATFSMIWAEELGVNGKGVKARIFSDYPFPWSQSGGPKDKFEETALQELRKNPSDAFYDFEKKNNA